MRGIWVVQRSHVLLWLLLACMPGLWLAASAPARADSPGNAPRWITSATRIDAAAAAQAAAGEAVRLPDAWNREGRAGLWIYRAGFEVPAGQPGLSGQAGPTGSTGSTGSPGQWGLYVPRVGNRVRVMLNGRSVGQLGGFEGDLSDHAQRPQFFHLPTELLRPGANTLEFTLQGERARYAGLSPMMVGPVDAVRRAFVWRELLQTWGSFAIVVVATVFALASGALAAVMRDRVFLLFALSCAFCAVRTTYALVTATPFDYRLWNLIVDFAFTGYLACLCLFCLEVLKTRRRWVLGATAALLAATLVLVPLYAYGRLAWARQAWTSAMVVYSLALSLMVIAVWWRTRTTPARILAVAGGLSVAMGVYDHVLVFYTSDGFSSFALVRYSLLLFMAAMAWVLVDRYAGQARREQDIRRQLAADLQERTAQLMAQFEHQRELIETAAHQRERERLIQDLHDGMGLQLNTLLGMVEQGGLQPRDLTLEVRTAIDQMRMLVDSSGAFEGSLPELLGHIRYRIENRLQRVGLQLGWANELPATLNQVEPAKAIALQHLIFELTTNVIKHAGATRMSIAVAPAADGQMIHLDVRDDGQGFEAGDARPGLGMRSIQRRVADLAGAIEVQSAPGNGSQYRITFPPLH